MSQCPLTGEPEDGVDVALPLDVAQTLLLIARRQKDPSAEEREAMQVAGWQIEQAKYKENET